MLIKVLKATTMCMYVAHWNILMVNKHDHTCILNQTLFFNGQYGFRTEHSSKYAALELIDRVITEMDTNKIQLSIFSDLSKLFDTFDHTILLEKLKYYGVDVASHGLLKIIEKIEDNMLTLMEHLLK